MKLGSKHQHAPDGTPRVPFFGTVLASMSGRNLCQGVAGKPFLEVGSAALNVGNP